MALDESLFRGRQIKVGVLKSSLPSCDEYSVDRYIRGSWMFPRWLQREQTDRVLAPQTVAFHEPGSGHGEEASLHVHVTTVATHHPEAEDGPSGELTHLWRALLIINILIY